jgi:hypothetical protein
LEAATPRRSTGRLAPLTGIAFVVLAIVGSIIGGEPPAADSPVREIINNYTDNKTSIEIGAFVSVAAAVLLVCFGAYLRSVFSAAEGPDGMLSHGPWSNAARGRGRTRALPR